MRDDTCPFGGNNDVIAKIPFAQQQSGDLWSSGINGLLQLCLGRFEVVLLAKKICQRVGNADTVNQASHHGKIG